MYSLVELSSSLERADKEYEEIRYGTILGATFAAMFPDKVGVKIALESVRNSELTLTTQRVGESIHIGWSIRETGPVWTYWAFPMERHCNSLLPSIRSRRHPYASINTFVTATAQLDQIRLKFNAQQILRLKPEERAPKNTFVHPSCKPR